jgi:hypothetical protein
MGPLLHQTPAQVRVEAWEFLIGGGGIYNGLSWEYTVDHPASEGRGHRAVLKQLGVLKRFMEGLDLVRMHPRTSVVAHADAGVRVRTLVQEREDYVVYAHHGRRDERGSDVVYLPDGKERRVELVLELPAGQFKAYWINPASGRVMQVEGFAHEGGRRRVVSPVHVDDVLLRVKRRRS